MKDLYLTTKIAREHSNGTIVPKGTKGRVIDIMIEADCNRAMFFLEFDDEIGFCDWYSQDEIEDCDHA